MKFNHAYKIKTGTGELLQYFEGSFRFAFLGLFSAQDASYFPQYIWCYQTQDCWQGLNNHTYNFSRMFLWAIQSYTWWTNYVENLTGPMNRNTQYALSLVF